MHIYFIIVDTEFNYPKYFEENGGSVSLHSTRHSTSKNIGREIWKAELENNYKSLIELGYINDIFGSRAPYLGLDDDYLQILSEMGIKYDSTFSQGLNSFYFKIIFIYYEQFIHMRTIQKVLSTIGLSPWTMAFQQEICIT